jgi:Ca2+-binding EF-hand superfamily protein
MVNMSKRLSSLKIITSSTKLLALTKGRLENPPESKRNQKSQKLPPIHSTRHRAGLKCKQVRLGTLSIIKHSPSRTTKNRLLFNKSLPNSTRSKLKLKTIHWLISNYREEVDKLLQNCPQLIHNTNYQGHISHQKFEDFMTSIGARVDKFVIDRLFWVFDENGDGKIEPREIMVALELFRETSFKEKLEVFFDICDEDGSGDIDEEEFFNVLKLCVNSDKERKVLRESLHELFVAIDEDGNGVLTKDEIIKAASQSEAVKVIIEKSIMTCHGVDTWIANEFYNTIAFQPNGISSYKARDDITDMKNVFIAVEEEERLYESRCKIKEENIARLERWKKDNGHSDLSFDEKYHEDVYADDGTLIEY